MISLFTMMLALTPVSDPEGAPAGATPSAPDAAATSSDTPAPSAAPAETKPQPTPAETTPAVPTTGTAPVVSWGAQIRPRVEKSFGGNLGVPRSTETLDELGNYRVSQRSRATLAITADLLRARLTLQDVRVWATERSTQGDYTADGLDLHEGYVQLGVDDALRVGRQEIVFGRGRLLGNSDWIQQARTFDALVLWHQTPNAKLTFVATRVKESAGAHPFFDVLAGELQTTRAGLRLSVPVICMTNQWLKSTDRGPSTEGWSLATGGADLSFDGPWFGRAEVYGQTGTNHFAYLFAASAGYTLSELWAPMLGIEYLSGDKDHTNRQSGTFDTLFQSSRAFYGLMDRFANIAADTNDGGLVDILAQNHARLGAGTLDVAVHHFRLARPDRLGNDGALGIEADAVYSVPVVDHVTLSIGGGLFVDQGDIASARKTASIRTWHDWVYAGLDLSL
ncbi:MAG: alginate export family protein [Deltaproteobacteria bacterium]|nr:alginate export family protein [Deltaproteobacteria bacterium]